MDETKRKAIIESGRLDTSGLNFHDLFDIEEIQRIQDAFAEATGVASLILDISGCPITRPSRFTKLCNLIRSCPKGLERCAHSDAVLSQLNPGTPFYGACLSGRLLDGGTGISVGERQIAKWLIGQVIDDECGDEYLRLYAREIGMDETEALQALQEVPGMSRERFGKICEALHLIGKQLSELALKTWQQRRHIDESERINAALRDSEELYRALLQQSSEASVMIDPDSRRIIEANRHFSEMLGYSPQEMETKSAYDIMADSKAAVDRHYDEVISVFHELPVELRAFRRKNGQIVEVERSGAMIHIQGKKVYMMTARDVTDRRLNEEKLNFLSFHDTLTGIYNRS